jgi:ATP-dependent helicase/nuclease subunit B
MRIRFGWSLDGAAWSDGSALGEATLGPRGLLALLQTRLGLAHPPVAPVVRTAQYLTLLERVHHPWCADSLALDPWNTAAALLRLRDDAVAAGWDGTVADDAPVRVAALAAVERTVAVGPVGEPAATLGPAECDDLREIRDELRSLTDEGIDWPLGIDEIRLDERAETLPGLWPEILGRLAATGTRVVAPAATPAVAGAPEVTVVSAGDPWAAAEAAARFLRAGSGPGAENRATTVLATSSTIVLDHALRRRGLPAIGRVDDSAERARDQVLPLHLALAVAPVDVQDVAAFLELRVATIEDEDGRHRPVGLVPATVRTAFLDALVAEPGIGGPEWDTALGDLWRAAEADGPGSRAARDAEVAHDLDELLRHPLPAPAGPADPLDADLLDARLAGLETRLRALAGGLGDDGLRETLTQVAAVRSVLGMLGTVTPRLLREVIDAASDTGGSPFAVPEVADWDLATSPAHLLPAPGAVPPPRTVLWWGADDDGSRSPAVWDRAEAEALTARGARLLDPQDVEGLALQAQLRGLGSVTTIVAVRTARRADKAVGPHPLLEHLRPWTTPEPVPAEQLASPDGTAWHLAGRSLPLRPVAAAPRPLREDLTRTVPAGSDLLPTSLSYSQAETLIGCTLAWTFQRPFGLEQGSLAQVPTGNRMIGTLVHKVVETLFEVLVAPAADAGRLVTPTPEQIGDTFDELVPRFAAELLLPGETRRRRSVRATAVGAISTLFTVLAHHGLTMTGSESGFGLPVELDVDGTPLTVPFRGSRDVDALDRSTGEPVVIDLKWTNSRTKHRRLLADGESLQLASYVRSLLGDATGNAAPDGIDPDRRAAIGYFLLKQGEFASDDPRFGGASPSARSAEEIWDRQVAAVSSALTEVSRGTVTARSGQVRLAGPADKDRREAVSMLKLSAVADGGIWIDRPCEYCEFTRLCGLTGDAS